MSPLDTLLANLRSKKSELQAAPPDAAQFISLVYRRLATGDDLAQTAHQLTNRDVTVRCKTLIRWLQHHLAPEPADADVQDAQQGPLMRLQP